MMACKYTKQKNNAHRFLCKVSDDSLFERREQHEAQQKGGLADYVTGSHEHGSRLIWMREVRFQITERGL